MPDLSGAFGFNKSFPLIGLYGRARSGKDTAADFIAGRYGMFKYAFAEPLKTMLKSVFGDNFHTGDRERICPETGVSYRVMMQQLGTELGRERWGEEVWVNLVERKFKELQAENCLLPIAEGRRGLYTPKGMVISDVRFDSEALWIRKQGGLVIELQRPGVEQVGISGHASEAGIDKGLINYSIMNVGTVEQLHTSIINLLEW